MFIAITLISIIGIASIAMSYGIYEGVKKASENELKEINHKF